jgi:hypothetical protein
MKKKNNKQAKVKNKREGKNKKKRKKRKTRKMNLRSWSGRKKLSSCELHYLNPQKTTVSSF